MLANIKANSLKIVKMAKLYSHGTIFFSYSFRRAMINIEEVTKITIPPSMENSANTIRALRTERKDVSLYNMINIEIIHSKKLYQI